MRRPVIDPIWTWTCPTCEEENDVHHTITNGLPGDVTCRACGAAWEIEWDWSSDLGTQLSFRPASELDRLRAKNLTPAELRYQARVQRRHAHWDHASWYEIEAEAQEVAAKVRASREGAA